MSQNGLYHGEIALESIANENLLKVIKFDSDVLKNIINFSRVRGFAPRTHNSITI